MISDILEDKAKETTATLPDAISLRCDVSIATDVEAMTAAALDAYGRSTSSSTTPVARSYQPSRCGTTTRPSGTGSSM